MQRNIAGKLNMELRLTRIFFREFKTHENKKNYNSSTRFDCSNIIFRLQRKDQGGSMMAKVVHESQKGRTACLR